jgi:hypothetical protein
MKKYIILFILLFGAGIAISDIDTFEGTATDSLSDIEGSTVAGGGGGGCTPETDQVLDEYVDSAEQSSTNVYGNDGAGQLVTYGSSGTFSSTGVVLSVKLENAADSPDCVVQLWTTSAGEPDEPISGATASLARGEWADTTNYYDKFFEWGTLQEGLVQGTEYAIVMQVDGNTGSHGYYWEKIATGEVPYGDLYTTSDITAGTITWNDTEDDSYYQLMGCPD